MEWHEVIVRLAKIQDMSLTGHRHNCGQGPHPRDCSRLDAIGTEISNLAKDIQNTAPRGSNGD